jgi:hypothetical protein
MSRAVMKRPSGRLTAVVAAVAVVAVTTGGVIAARQGPGNSGGTAAPLTGPLASTTPTATPSLVATPTPAPTTPVAPTGTASGQPSAETSKSPTTTNRTGPADVELDLDNLAKGSEPELPYLFGRQVRGGPGQPIRVPGEEPIREVARVRGAVLAIVVKDHRPRLVRFSGTAPVEEIPGVDSLVSTDDGAAAAYAVNRTNSTGLPVKGVDVYAERGTVASRQRLRLPNGWYVTVLAFQQGKVFFRSATGSQDSTSGLYSWIPGRPAASRIGTVSSPTALSSDGKIVASSQKWGPVVCSTVSEIAGGRPRWHTCDHLIQGFTPGDKVAIAVPPMGTGYSSATVAALDATTGTLLRRWSGVAFVNTSAEDDDHLLMEVDQGPGTAGAILRCSISTGHCDRATPVTWPQSELEIGR